MAGRALGANYWKLWSASVVSNFGDGVALVAYPWLASALTRNPLHIALVGAATRLPWLVVTLPAGVITDRVDRRKLVAFSDLFRLGVTLIVAMAVLASQADLATPEEVDAGRAVTPDTAPWLLLLLYVAALALGTAEVLRDNGAQTLLPTIVGHTHLERANGRLWAAESVAGQFIGPPVAGLLLAISFATPFFVDAATFGLAAIGVLALRVTVGADSTSTSTNGAGSTSGSSGGASDVGDGGRSSWRTELVEGLGWLWGHPVFRTMAIILGVMNGLLAAAMATYVLFVQEVLGLSADSFGLLLTSGSVGAVAGGLTASRVAKLIGSGASLFVTLGATAIVMTITALTTSAVLVWVLFAVLGYVAVLWNVITVSLRQAVIPDRLLGRVNSVYRLFAWGSIPIGGLVGGLLVDGAEIVVSRGFALRVPFVLSALGHLLLLAWALPTLNTESLESAKVPVQPNQRR